MASGNPLFNEKAYEEALCRTQRCEGIMTLQGTINKAFFLLFLCMTGGVLGFRHYQAWGAFLIPIALVCLALALTVIFTKKTAPLLAPFYALGEGLVLGMISASFSTLYDGIAGQAVTITLLVFLLMLFIYKTGLIRVTRGFSTGVIAATGAVALFYVGSLVLMFFGIPVSYFTENTTTNLIINIIICVIAALNFLLDFKFIDTLTSEVAVPKFMEWYAAFSLMVTLVWLYLDILRALGRGRSR